MSKDSGNVITVVALLAWTYFAFSLIHYGEVWQYQHHPSRNVTVTFAGGSTITGDLSSRFDGLRELRHADQVTVFSIDSIREMSVPLPNVSPADGVNAITVTSHWRLLVAYAAYLLPLLATALWLSFAHVRNAR